MRVHDFFGVGVEHADHDVAVGSGEDAFLDGDDLIADGEPLKVFVIADGMGGHSAGDVASKIVVTEVFSELKFHSDLFFDHDESLPFVMENALRSANDCMREAMRENEESRGMGSTVIATVLAGNRMFWSSIGDSPLYHFRGRKMEQINEDHSMAPVIASKLASGKITEAEAREMDRNQLTSVVMGGAIPKVDCPEDPLIVSPADVLILGSDGLQYISDAEIQDILRDHQQGLAQDIAEAALYLASDAGRFVNCHDLVVDGDLAGAVRGAAVRDGLYKDA